MPLVCMPRNNEYLYYLLNNRNKNYSILLKKNYSLKKKMIVSPYVLLTVLSWPCETSQTDI